MTIAWQGGVLTPRAPNLEEVEALVSGEKTLGSRTLDYQIWDGEPHVLFISKGYSEAYDRLVFTHLVFDWTPNTFPFLPSWRPAPASYSIEPTTAPASLGDAHCTGVYYGDCINDTEVFGQVNSREITTIELDLKGTRHRYPVSYPGFMLSLEGFRGLPDNYRWLNPDGRMVWTATQAPARTGGLTRPDGARAPVSQRGNPLPLS